MSRSGHRPDPIASEGARESISRRAMPYFSDPALKQRLDLLQHLTEYADLLLLIKGPYGAGKTALLQQLVARARDHWLVCVIDANPLTTRDQLLSQFGDRLGLELRGVAIEEWQAVVEERLATLQRAGRVVLLIVDDAHALAAPVLDLVLYLFELSAAGEKLVRVILCAEPSLDETLQSPALRALQQQVTHTLDVPPLTREQTGEFLEHHYTATGRAEALPLTAAAVQAAYAQSGGIPGMLLALGDALTPTAAPVAEEDHQQPREKRFHWPPSPRTLLAAGGVVLVLVALFFQEGINDFVEPEPDVLVQADKPGTVPLPLPEPVSPVAPRTDQGTASPPVVGRLPQVEEPPPAAQPEPLASAETPVEAAPLISEATPEPTPQPTPPGPAVKPPVPAPVTKPQAAAAEPKPPAAPDRPTRLDRAWLASRPAEHYTLQLLGVRDESALREFVKDNALEGKVAYLRTTHQGGAWHILLHGDYADRDAAVKARAQLVRTLRGVEPWPRTFASVHEQMNR